MARWCCFLFEFFYNNFDLIAKDLKNDRTLYDTFKTVQIKVQEWAWVLLTFMTLSNTDYTFETFYVYTLNYLDPFYSYFYLKRFHNDICNCSKALLPFQAGKYLYEELKSHLSAPQPQPPPWSAKQQPLPLPLPGVKNGVPRRVFRPSSNITSGCFFLSIIGGSLDGTGLVWEMYHKREKRSSQIVFHHQP